MESLYNVYFAGELLDGHSPDSAREKMGKLFNADEATLNKLFSGKPQLLKRECDKSTALKYQQAIERAGAKPIIKAITSAAEAISPPTAPATTDIKQTMSAAQRIAALAQAPDKVYESQDTSDEFIEGWYVGAVGSDILRPWERAQPIVNEIDTSELVLDEPTDHLATEAPPPPPAPDTGHLSMGDVGEDIPTLPSDAVPLNPNTDALNLSPEGTDFSDCTAPPPESPELDLSNLNVAPEGAELLEDKYRDKHTTPGPDTGHISLED